jgi:endonuclease YncB( thermonuclease family)
MMAVWWGLGVVLGLAWFGGCAHGAETWRGLVVRAVDGDTVSFMNDDISRIWIRLYGVDAPEKDQEGGREATKALARMIVGREVKVIVQGDYPYYSPAGLIYLDGENVNLQLVAEGHAWVNERSCVIKKICLAMVEAQKRARAQRLGLWHRPNPEPPWEYRR